MINPDDIDYAEQLESFAEEKSAMIKHQFIAHGEMKAQIHAVLTPEQRTKAKQLMEKR